MPRNVAQWTGIAVAALVVLGRDVDVLYALPLGLAAGATASLVVFLADQAARRGVPVRIRRR